MAHHHNPASVDAYFRQGNSLYEMELYEEAIDAYTSAIRSNPDSIIAFYNRGLANSKGRSEIRIRESSGGETGSSHGFETREKERRCGPNNPR